MKYLCLIFDEEQTFETMPKSQLDALMDEYRAFGESIRKSGHYVNGSQLAPTRTASTFACGMERCRSPTVHSRDEEQLAGYY
jgi:hypothetical protein